MSALETRLAALGTVLTQHMGQTVTLSGPTAEPADVVGILTAADGLDLVGEDQREAQTTRRMTVMAADLTAAGLSAARLTLAVIDGDEWSLAWPPVRQSEAMTTWTLTRMTRTRLGRTGRPAGGGR